MAAKHTHAAELAHRHKVIMRELSAVEAPRVMYLTVLIIVLFDLGYAAAGIFATTGYYLSDLAQSIVLAGSAWLITHRKIPLQWVPATFMIATIANNMATTYQSTIVGQGSLGVIAIMLAIAGAIALSWRPFLIGAAVCVAFTSTVIYFNSPDIWVTWAITMVTATGMSAVVLYGRSNSAMGLAIAQLTIEQAATVDPLTKLFNRRGLEEDAGRIVGAARRSGDPYFVVFIDVAGLKRVNDQYGHAVGDRLLLRVANALAQHSRAEELLCRWGGDEFILLGVGAKPDPEVLHDRLQTAIDMTDLEEYWAPNLWIGSAEGSPSAHTLEHVIMLADHDMYERRAIMTKRDPQGSPA